MKITKGKHRQEVTAAKSRIVAAGEFDLLDEEPVDGEEFSDTVDDLADTFDDMSEQLEDIEEDEVDIETENNIANHYIAECDTCQGVFISALVESDQEVEKITGVCPLCGKDTEQYLCWIVREV